MFSLTKTAVLFAAVCCGFSTIAHAEDVYSGRATVQTPGRGEGCVAIPVKIIVADGRFGYGNGGEPVAAGPIAADGAFSGSFVKAVGKRGAVETNVTVTGRIQNGKITGSTSASSGCVLSFTLTKQ